MEQNSKTHRGEVLKVFRRLLLGEHVVFIWKLSAVCLRLLFPVAQVMFSFAKGCLIKQNRAFLIAIDKQIRLRLCVQFFKCYDNTARVKLSMKCRLNFFFFLPFVY